MLIRVSFGFIVWDPHISNLKSKIFLWWLIKTRPKKNLRGKIHSKIYFLIYSKLERKSQTSQEWVDFVLTDLMFMKEQGWIFMKRWHNVYFELRSQPSPSFKAHPLSFEQGSLHTGGLVAYRPLSIPGHWVDDVFFRPNCKKQLYWWSCNIVRKKNTLMMKNHIDRARKHTCIDSHWWCEFRKLTEQRDQHQHIPENRRWLDSKPENRIVLKQYWKDTLFKLRPKHAV